MTSDHPDPAAIALVSEAVDRYGALGVTLAVTDGYTDRAAFDLLATVLRRRLVTDDALASETPPAPVAVVIAAVRHLPYSAAIEALTEATRRVAEAGDAAGALAEFDDR